MPQPPFEVSAASVDPHRADRQQALSAQKDYSNDKEDESFLAEVEDSLLRDSTERSGPMNENSDDGSSGSPTLFSASLGNSPLRPTHSRTSSNGKQREAQYGYQHQHLNVRHDDTSALDHPSAFRRKLRAALFYLLCSTIHEGVIYKIAQRTTWSTATLFIPFELLISTALAGLVTLYMRKSSNLHLQHAIGIHGLPILPSLAWKESAPLAALTVAAAVLRILKDAYLEASISTAVSSYIAPALCIILPVLYLNNELPRNGFLLLASITVPTLYGLAITDLHVLSSAIILSMIFVFVEAGKLAIAKKWFLSKGGSPVEAIFQYLPPATLLALIFVAPVAATIGKHDRLPYRWHFFFLSHLFTSLLNQVSTLIAINAFTSPVSVALLTVPKGLLVTIINGGILQGHQRASHSIFVTFCISTLTLCLSTPEIRNCFVGENRNHLPSSLNSKSEERLEAEVSRERSGAYLSPKAVHFLSLASFLPIVYWFISQILSSPIDLTSRFQTLQYYTHSPTVDIVIAYYDEEIDRVHDTIENLRYYPWIKNQDPRFIIYSKAAQENATMSDEEFLTKTGADQVYHLKNRGRESGTYLRHILRNYNDSIDPSLAQAYRPAGLADHTIFMQPHLAWEWIAKERLWLFQPNTGYLHFAPYLKLDCGKDMNGNGDFPRLREIYNIFTEELCPPTLQLGAYSSQFVASKKRILANAYHKYQAIDDVLEAEAEHWIHTEGTWWKYHGEPGPTNPYFGHAMERAWPTIFGCTNPAISDTCAGEIYNVTGCQCFD